MLIHYEHCLCSPDWAPIQEVPGGEERATIPDLVEGNQYEFRVRAVNKAGTSEPSDPTAPHTAKHKKCNFEFYVFLF